MCRRTAAAPDFMCGFISEGMIMVRMEDRKQAFWKPLLKLILITLILCFTLCTSVLALPYGANAQITLYKDSSQKVRESYSKYGKKALADFIRSEFIPGVYGLRGSEAASLQIKVLVHFSDGDYLFDNAKGTVKKVSSKSSSSKKSKTSKLAAPKNLRVVYVNGKINISWKKVKKAKKYYLYRKIGSGKYKRIKKLKKTSYTDSSSKLKAGVKVRYYVVAVSSKGKEGKKSAVKTVRIPVTPTKVKLDATAANMATKDTLQLTATVTPNNAIQKKVFWKSSNEEVADVSDEGLVTTKNAGNVTITAETSNGKKAVCKIRVTGIAARGEEDLKKAKIDYKKFKASASAGIYHLEFLEEDPITGACTDMVPQGICVTDKYILVTAYCNAKHENEGKKVKKEVHSSILYVADKETGKKIKTLRLGDRFNENRERIINMNHVGGLVVDDHDCLWIANSTDGTVEAIPMSFIEEASDGDKISAGTICTCYVDDAHSAVIQSVSFVTYYNDTLYVGYCANRGDKAKKGRDCSSSLYGYSVYMYDDVPYKLNFKEELSIPYTTDGACFLEHKGTTWLVTNQHGSRKEESSVTYSRILKERTKISAILRRPLTFDMPCLLENVATDGTYIYNIYESGAKKFAIDPKTMYSLPYITKAKIEDYLNL